MTTGTIVQSWVPVNLANELKARASSEQRSVSSVIRLALEQELYRPGDQRLAALEDAAEELARVNDAGYVAGEAQEKMLAYGQAVARVVGAVKR